MKQLILIFLIIGISASTLLSQHPLEKRVKRFEIISTEHGLSSSTVRCIFEDSRGFLWIGTLDGLNRYDGHSFKIFRNNPDDSTSLLNDQIVSIDEGYDGQFWISTHNGYCRFNPRTETFERFGENHQLHGYSGESLIADSINSVWFIPEKNWIPDPPYSIVQYNIVEDTCIVHRFKTGSKDKPGMFGRIKKSSEKHAYIYYPYSTGFVLHLDIPSRKIDSLRYLQNGQLKLMPKIRIVHFFKDGSLIVKDPNDKLGIFNYHYDPAKKTIRPYSKEDIFDPDPQYLKSQLVNARVFQDSVYFRQCTLFGHEDFAETVKDLLETVEYESLDGSIWVGTRNLGLGVMYPTATPIENLRHNPNNANGLSRSQNWGIWEDAGEGLWITSQGVDYLDYKTNKITHYKEDFKSIYNSSPNSKEWFQTQWPHRTMDGTLFIVVIPGWQLYVLDKKKDKFVDFMNDYLDIQLPFKVMTTPYQDSKGRYYYAGNWAARAREGFVVHDTVTNKIKHIKPGEDGLPDFYSFRFCEDVLGNIWFSTMAYGPGRLNPESDKIDFFTEQFLNHDGTIRKAEMTSIYRDNEGNMWLGHDGIGVDVIPVEAIKKDSIYFINYNSANSGLNGNMTVHPGIVEDGSGHIWVVNVEGISRFDPKTKRFKSFRFMDQFGDLKRNVPIHKGESGHIFICGLNKGVIIFHPDSIKENQKIPSVHITGLRIQNIPIAVRGTYGDTLKWDSPLQQSALFTESFEINYNQNDITFEFAALNYTYPEDNQYKYKLEGYQDDWVNTTADRPFAAYTNLSPGDYTFRVIGSNNDGIWNDEGDSMNIIIHPPIWSTTWAYSFYALCILGIGFSIRYYERRRFVIKEKARTLEAMDQMKTRFFTNISHEFRTPLTLIQGPIKSMYEGTFKGDQKAIMGMVLRNSQRLLRLINQLLDLSKIEAGSLKLKAQESDVAKYIQLAIANFESVAVSKEISLNYSCPEVPVMIWFDHEKMERILFNLVGNAIKFTPNGGKIDITLNGQDQDCDDKKFKTGAVKIVVRDSGNGIHKKDLPKIFDRFYQAERRNVREAEGTGIGLALVKELVELHHGEIRVESEEGWGTTFTMLLPKGKNHLAENELIITPEEKEIKSDLKEPASIELDIEFVPISGANTRQATDRKLPIILIVEDNTDMRRYIRTCIGNEYNVIEAVNGIEGLETATQEVPDMILSDVMMPGMDGNELCLRIRENETTSHIPLILLTAKADQDSRISGLKRGADDYLAKPFDADELRIKIRNQLDRMRKFRSFFSKQLVMQGDIEQVESLDDQFIKKTYEIVNGQLDNSEFTVEEFARLTGMSQTQLYRKVLALTGQTPNEFIRSLRLKKAAQLILQQFGNVSDVAYAVGFNNLSYFAKCFKKQFGVTPNSFGQNGRIKFTDRN